MAVTQCIIMQNVSKCHHDEFPVTLVHAL